MGSGATTFPARELAHPTAGEPGPKSACLRRLRHAVVRRSPLAARNTPWSSRGARLACVRVRDQASARRAREAGADASSLSCVAVLRISVMGALSRRSTWPSIRGTWVGGTPRQQARAPSRAQPLRVSLARVRAVHRLWTTS